MIGTGARVRIRPEWRSGAGGDEVYVVVAGEEAGKPRLTIAPEVWRHGAIIPTEVVQVAMVEVVS